MQMDWRAHEKLYGAVSDAVKKRVRDASVVSGVDEEKEEHEEEEWVKERIKRVGEGMRKRFKALMGGGGERRVLENVPCI